MTAGGRSYLRSLPLAKLKDYVRAYRINVGRDVLEKDDIINAIVSARVSLTNRRSWKSAGLGYHHADCQRMFTCCA